MMGDNIMPIRIICTYPRWPAEARGRKTDRIDPDLDQC